MPQPVWQSPRREGCGMKQYDFTLGFAVMAANELDARVKLKELLMAISKEEIFKAMRIVKEKE